jgi:hypothetical protein
VRSDLIEVPSPRLEFAPGVVQRQEPMRIQAFVAQPTIEGLASLAFGFTNALSVGFPGRLKSKVTLLMYAQ